MAPYFEGERRLEAGERVSIGPGLKKTEVEIWSDDSALVTPPENRDSYIGDYDSNKSSVPKFKRRPTAISGRFTLLRQSVSTNPRRPQVIWKKK